MDPVKNLLQVEIEQGAAIFSCDFSFVIDE
jgi:hypothetical protein